MFVCTCQWSRHSSPFYLWSHLNIPVVWTGDIDYPGPGPRALNDRQQQPGQQVGGDVVYPELKLETVPREGVWGPRVLDTGAVDEYVHPALRLQHPRRELPHRAQAGQVTVLHLELSLAWTKNEYSSITAHTNLRVTFNGTRYFLSRSNVSKYYFYVLKSFGEVYLLSYLIGWELALIKYSLGTCTPGWSSRPSGSALWRSPGPDPRCPQWWWQFYQPGWSIQWWYL